MSFGSGETLRKQVELLVQASGQDAVDAVAGSLERVEQRVAAYQAQLQAGLITHADFLEKIRDEATLLGTLSKAMDTAVEAQDALARGFKSIADARRADAEVAKNAVVEQRVQTEEEKATQAERTENLRQALKEMDDVRKEAGVEAEANIKENTRKRSDLEKQSAREVADIDRAHAVEREANIKENDRKRADLERQGAKELADIDKAHNVEREANIRESAAKRAALEKQSADELAEIDRAHRVEREANIRQDAEAVEHARQQAAKVAALAEDSADSQNRRARAASRAMLEFSRGLEDFATAGPIGALNNIPTFFYNIGQALNWTNTTVTAATAGVSLLATASYLVYQNWELITRSHPQVRDFFKSLGEGLNPFHVVEYTGALDRLGKRVEELTKNKHRLAIETAELDTAEAQVKRIKAGLHEFERGKEQQSKAEQESGKRVEEIFREAPGGREAMQRQLELDLRGRLYAGSAAKAELDKRAAEAARTRDIKVAQAAPGLEYIPLQNFQEEMEKINDERNTVLRNFDEASRAMVGNLFRDAISGHGARQRQAREQLMAFFGARPGIPGMAGRQIFGGPTTIGGQIAAATPEAEAEQKRMDEEFKASRVDRERAERDEREERQRVAQRNQAEAASIRTEQQKAHQATQEAEKAERERVAAGKKMGAPVVREMEKEVARAAPGLEGPMADFLARNAIAMEQRRLMLAQPGGARMVAAMDREADTQRRIAQQQIEANRRNPAFKRQRAAMTPEERAMEDVQDRLRLQSRPRSAQGAENFAAQVASRAFAAGGLGQRDPNLAGVMGQDMAARARLSMQAKFQQFFVQSGNFLQSMVATDAQIVGQLNQHQAHIGRLMQGAAMNQRNLRNNRQTQLRIAR
jgi:hypothetical protein